MEGESETLTPQDVGDLTGVVIGPERDLNSVVRALAPLVRSACGAASVQDEAGVVGVAVALGEFGLTRFRAVALAVAMASAGIEPIGFLATMRIAYNAAEASHEAGGRVEGTA